MPINWSLSAAKHGIERADALNAIQCYVYWIKAFDEPRLEGAQRPDLWIGPNRDRTRMIEVMAEVTPPNGLFIFHVMEARRRLLDVAEEHGHEIDR